MPNSKYQDETDDPLALYIGGGFTGVILRQDEGGADQWEALHGDKKIPGGPAPLYWIKRAALVWARSNNLGRNDIDNGVSYWSQRDMSEEG